MKIQATPTLVHILFVFLSYSWAAYANTHGHNHNHNDHEDFLKCLSEQFMNYNSISNIIYTPVNSSYTSVLRSSIQNYRFMSEFVLKPQVIITPEREFQIPPIIYCAKDNDMEIRIRSGGHDYEGLSYISTIPFVIIDLINLSEVTVDTNEKTAWVSAGATLGSLYYKIAEQSPTLGFPGGVCPTVGVGGYISGGGYGPLLRKYGLGADNVIDARIIGVNGKILDRKSMGEDLFWAIRGGGGTSFGVILAWKVQLVDVPEIVTVFTIQRTLEQNATKLVHRWQDIAHIFDRDLFIRIIIARKNSKPSGKNSTIHASFNSIFFGKVDRLLPLMQQSFPELNLRREDCTEMNWIQSTLYFAKFSIDSREALLNRNIKPNAGYFKAKSDYVKKPIPKSGLEGLWRLVSEPEGKEALITLTPYGGVMDEISEATLPFPHRAGILYSIQYMVYWDEKDARNSEIYVNWIRGLYSYMAPYVSSSPREAYINYRDLDIGVNNIKEKASYAQASNWGVKYFKDNFDRLVQVKTTVDPENFFKNEQSIPPLDVSCKISDA